MGKVTEVMQHLAELRRWQSVGMSMRKDGAKPSISNHIPGEIRAGIFSQHFLMSPVLQKQAPVLETLEGLVPRFLWWRQGFP